MNTTIRSRVFDKVPIVVTIFFAMVLVVMRLPQEIEAWRPDWLALVVIAWAIFVPHIYGPACGMLTGLAADVVLAESFGVYALSYALLAYMTNTINIQMRMFTLLQQIVVIFVLTLIARVLLFFLGDLSAGTYTDWGYWTPLVTNMIAWPWVYFLVRNTRLVMATRVIEAD